MKKYQRIISTALILISSVMLLGCSATKEPQKEPEKKPTDDGVLNILMIGNSFCYYFTDELYDMLEQAGIKATVSNVYYSGCNFPTTTF